MAAQTLNNVIIQVAGTGASPATYVDIPGVVSHEEPEVTVEETDVTDYNSSDKWRRFITSLITGGAMTVQCNYTPGNTVMEQIRAANYAGLKMHCRIMLDGLESPSTPVTAATAEVLLTFKGMVGFKASGSIGDQIKATVTIKPDGPVAIAEPT